MPEKRSNVLLQLCEWHIYDVGCPNHEDQIIASDNRWQQQAHRLAHSPTSAIALHRTADPPTDDEPTTHHRAPTRRHIEQQPR